MSYRKIKPVLTTINNLANVCGLFTSDTDLNNGYGCKSKSNEKDHPGCCYDFDCPLAIGADLTSLKEHDIDLYKEHLPDFKMELERGTSEDDCCVDSWIIQYRELV